MFDTFPAFETLSKDVHTELIQHKRSWMIKRGIVKGKLSVDSSKRRRNGSCPLMPEEVRDRELSNKYKYQRDTLETFCFRSIVVDMIIKYATSQSGSFKGSCWVVGKPVSFE